MIIRKANAQDIKALLHSFPGVKSVLCTGVDGYTLLAMDNNNLIAFASVFKRETCSFKREKRGFYSVFLLSKEESEILFLLFC